MYSCVRQKSTRRCRSQTRRLVLHFGIVLVRQHILHRIKDRTQDQVPRTLPLEPNCSVQIYCNTTTQRHSVSLQNDPTPTYTTMKYLFCNTYSLVAQFATSNQARYCERISRVELQLRVAFCSKQLVCLLSIMQATLWVLKSSQIL